MKADCVYGFGKGISWPGEGTVQPSSSHLHTWVAVKIRGLGKDPGVIEPPCASPLPTARPLTAAQPRTATYPRTSARPTSALPSGGRGPLDQASWCLIDPCWAAGSGMTQAGRLVFKKKYSDVYFLTSPELFVLDHLPFQDVWQLVPPANYVSRARFSESQGRARYGWRPITHPLTSITLSAAALVRHGLRIRLELCMPLETSFRSINFKMYWAVGGPGGSYSRGDLISSCTFGEHRGAPGSSFQLSISFVQGVPCALDYCVSCSGAPGFYAGRVLRLEAELGVETVDIPHPVMPSRAIYHLHIT